MGAVEIGWRLNRMSNTKSNNEWMNARQVYDAYGIVRGVLNRLADAGKIERKTINDDPLVLNLFRVSDIEKLVNGGNDQ